MKAKEKYDYYATKVSEAWKNLMDLDKEIAEISGFGDMDSIPAYKRAYADWQYAQGNFNNYLSWIQRNNIDPSDEV